MRIEILNPKAMQLIKGMEALNLIKLTNEPATQLQSYLKKMRNKADSVPGIEEITAIVEGVRAKRYEKKKSNLNNYRY